MSLNWSTENIKYFNDNPDTLFVKCKHEGLDEEYEDVNPETKSLIFMSMAIGLGSIKDSNIDEWYARCKINQKFHNFGLYIENEDEIENKDQVIYEILTKHIGLSTNVSDLSSAKWSSLFLKNWYELDGESPTLGEIKALITVYKMDAKAYKNKEKEKVN
jgi:hypothetical protein